MFMPWTGKWAGRHSGARPLIRSRWRSGTRLAVEALEDRTVPAAITPVAVQTTSYWEALNGNPQSLINGSGLSGLGSVFTMTHDNEPGATSAWHAGALDGGLGGPTGNPPPVLGQMVDFDLGDNFNLTGSYVWNHNQAGNTGRGVKQMEVYVSSSLTGSYTLVGTYTLNQASGINTEHAQFLGTSAEDVRRVRFRILSDWNNAANDYVGMSEVRFDGLPHVPNAAPTVTAAADQSASEGTAASISLGSFADPGSVSPWAVTVSWGDGKSDSFTTSSPGSLGSLAHTYADDGTYTVTVAVKDKAAAEGSATFRVAVANVAPSVAITGAPAAGPEGAAIALGSSASDPAGTNDPLTYAWSVTKNGTAYGATGSAVSYSFTPDDNGTYVVTLTVTDGDGGSTTVSKTVQVTDVAPTPTITGTTSGQQGFAVTLQGSATDPGLADAAGLVYAWSVTKGGQPVGLLGVQAAGLVGVQSAGPMFTLVPTEAGTYTVTFTVTDKDGVSASTTREVVVTAVPGVTLLVSGRLVIVGTDAADDIKVNPGGGAREIKVNLNGVQRTFAGVREIVVYANGGNDNVQVAGGVTVPVAAFGGAGNDRIKAGGGPSILIGGDGDDVLTGGAGRNILIGGRGANLVCGNGAGDILVTGPTPFTANLFAPDLDAALDDTGLDEGPVQAGGKASKGRC